MKLSVWCWLFQHSRLDIRVPIQLFIWLLDWVSVLFQIQTLMRCYSCSAFPGATGARCPGSSYEVDEGVACTVRALSDSTVVYQVVHCSLSTWKYESNKNNFRYYAPTLFFLQGNVPKATGCTDEMVHHYNYLTDKTFRLGNSKWDKNQLRL